MWCVVVFFKCSKEWKPENQPTPKKTNLTIYLLFGVFSVVQGGYRDKPSRLWSLP